LRLRFILGRAGTGKTYICLKEIQQVLTQAPEGSPLILLVPEQATFQNELALLTESSMCGTIRAQVLSFRRLAWRVLQETGGATRKHISEPGKCMILRNLLEKRASQLKVFQRATKKEGFYATLTRTLTEMKLNRLSVDDLKAVKTEKQELLTGKLHDLAILYAGMENYLVDRYLDPDDYLQITANQLHQSPAILGAEIWVDGFTGFTPQEYYVLEKILLVAKRVTVTLCLDNDQLPGENDLFYSTWETRQKIKDIAVKAGALIEADLNLNEDIPPRWSAAPDLAYLEKNFFDYAAPSFNLPPPGLKLVAAASKRAEVEGVAREITRLCRDLNYRWRDMAVILRNPEDYYALINTIFTDHEIPFFIDLKRPVHYHPLVELIRAACDIVITNWSYEAVFRYLKTDLIPVAREQIDLLENYVLAYGIKGSRWTDNKDWTYRRHYLKDSLEEDYLEAEKETVSASLAAINQIKKEATQALRLFQEEVKKAKNGQEIILSLFKFLITLDIPGRLSSWRNEALDLGQLEQASEHTQIWAYVVDLLEQLVEIVGTEKISLEEYSQMLNAGLENLRLGLIPPGLDQVLISSLDRSRNPNVRSAFVLGVNDGILPARGSRNVLFNEAEKEFLEQAGLTFFPGEKRRLYLEQFLVYTALTRSTEFLGVSYVLADNEGRAATPSIVVSRLKEIFPHLKEEFWAEEPDGLNEEGFITRPARSLAYLTSRLRIVKAGKNINPVWWGTYSWLVSQEKWRERCKRVLSSLFYINQEPPLPVKLSRSLYGNPVKASVSKIEKFNACPFAYFLTYGLGLKERAQYKLTVPDLGEFYHAALKEFHTRVLAKKINWSDLKPKDCALLTGEVVETLAPQLRNEILLSGPGYRYLTQKLIKTVGCATNILTEHARRGKFSLVGLELAFGPKGNLPPLRLKLKEDTWLELSGRIDRVDLITSPKGNYLKVIDYKSGAVELNLNEIFYGLKLQLLAYLDLVLNYAPDLIGSDALAAGMLYFTLQNPLIISHGPLDPDLVDKEVLKKLKMKGLLLADPEIISLMDNLVFTSPDLLPVAFKKDGCFTSRSSVISATQFTILRQHLRQTLKAAGEEIMAGVVAIKPYRGQKFASCRYCQFKAICKFDPLLPENNFRLLPSPSKKEIWQGLSQVNTKEI